MSGRDPGEEHRPSTPLELFFDLCFVVAVAAAAASLHHDLAEGHLSGVAGYAMVFFAIWWAWLNYTWFASAYDTDDVIFRLTTFVVMTGVLVLASGVPRAAEGQDFGVLVVGYVIMRAALVPLWLRVAREHADARPTALRYAAGVSVVQVLWILRLLLPHDGAATGLSFVVLAVLEMATPYWAERVGAGTPWHRHHIAERYELFTIIVLGEVILASSQAISSAVDGHGLDLQLLLLVAGALVLLFSMWWLYFKVPMIDSLTPRTAFAFGYGHYFVFSSIAAVGACLAVLVDVAGHGAHVSTRTSVSLLVAAVSTYLVALSVVHGLRRARPVAAWPTAVLVVVLVVIALAGLPAGTSVVLVGLTVSAGLEPPRAPQRLSSGSSATATKSSERYMLDQWNSRIGRTTERSLLPLARCHIRWDSSRKAAPRIVATTG